VREAPALTLIEKSIKAGATVRGFDPVAAINAKAEVGPGLNTFEDLYETLKGADALVVCTDWNDFKSPDFGKIKSLLKSPVIFDGRNLYRRPTMKEQGFTYYSVGRAPVKPE